MKLSFVEEPELEFCAGRHIDIRYGITTYGPLDATQPDAPKRLVLGIVGSTESVEGVRSWLDKCSRGIPAKTTKNGDPHKQPNLFPEFPGCNNQTGFRTTLVCEEPLCRHFSPTSIADLARGKHRIDRITRAVDLFMDEIQYLAQNTTAKVIVCAVPIQLLEAMGPDDGPDDNDDASASDTSAAAPDFHDLLKARVMQQYRKPIQLILPSTYDDTQQRRQSKTMRRELQDEATRAWNIHTALYYKADGIPWRLVRESTEHTVCYVGVSFYRSLDQQHLMTSVAQVFNARGEGIVVRGGAATISKEDRQPHLSEAQAHELLKRGLKEYWDAHGAYPARVALHKSSQFNKEELAGFDAALQECHVGRHDFLWLSPGDTKLFRAGVYPPLRGTLLSLQDSEFLLYTRGSVPFFATYPGQYIPVPRRVRLASATQTHRFLARELLALSKMNWNNTQFDGGEPVTLRAARTCGNVLRYCSEERRIEPRYSFYM